MGLLVASTWLFLADTPSHHFLALSFQHTLVILQINKTQCPVHSAQPCLALGGVLSRPIPSRNGTEAWLHCHLPLTCLSAVSTLPCLHLS